MAKRLDKTIADLVVAAVMPALLIGMLISLVYFLLELAYSGQYTGQMRNVLLFFIIAAVLIARITMMGDIADRAGLYGVALAIVTGLALVRFVDVPQSVLGGMGWIIPISLMAVIWWSAHKLTLDCTWDEETDSEDTGGLLDQQTEEPPSSTTVENDWFNQYQSERQAEQKRKKPGTMIIYFSLAALPLFGLGQVILPANDTAGRRYAFWLLVVYMACGLGLLLTTSFLGLRRYLRARKLQMPAAMTGLWLVLGGLLIAAILFLSTIIPRPEAEYALTNLMGWAISPDRDANDMHVFSGSSGKSNQSGRGPQNRQPLQSDPNNENVESNNSDGGHAGQQGGNRDGQSGSPSKQNGQSSPSSSGKDGQGSGQSQSGKSQSGNQSGNGKDENSKDSQQNQDNKQNQDQGNFEKKDSGGNSGQGERKTGSKGRENNKKQQDKSGQPKSDQDEGTDTTPSPRLGPHQPSQPPPPQSNSLSWNWLKWLIYAAMIMGALYALYRWGKQLWLALCQIWNDLKNWWRGLFSRQPRTATMDDIPDPETDEPPLPFSWFSNPFLHPDNFRSIEEMVRYSFAALHSWAYEQELARERGETPSEFATRLGEMRPAVQQEIRKLAELYALVTYSGRKAPASSESILRAFWGRLPAPYARAELAQAH